LPGECGIFGVGGAAATVAMEESVDQFVFPTQDLATSGGDGFARFFGDKINALKNLVGGVVAQVAPLA